MTLNMLLSVYSVDSRAATWVWKDVTREKRAHFKNEKIGILKACIGQLDKKGHLTKGVSMKRQTLKIDNSEKTRY